MTSGRSDVTFNSPFNFATSSGFGAKVRSLSVSRGASSIFGDKPFALAQRSHLQRVDRVDQAIELIGDR